MTTDGDSFKKPGLVSSVRGWAYKVPSLRKLSLTGETAREGIHLNKMESVSYPFIKGRKNKVMIQCIFRRN